MAADNSAELPENKSVKLFGKLADINSTKWFMAYHEFFHNSYSTYL